MDQLLITLLSWQFLLFCLGLAAIVEVIRRFVEYFEHDLKDLNLWNKLILPVAPVFMGVGFSLVIQAYPYPEGINSQGGRFIFGLVAGLLSTFIYRAIKGVITSFAIAREPAVPPTVITTTAELPATTTTTTTTIPSDDSLITSVRETINREPVIPDNSIMPAVITTTAALPETTMTTTTVIPDDTSQVTSVTETTNTENKN